jgi:hypothetical protein
VDWTLTVKVNASDKPHQKITQAPTGIDYAIGDVGLAARPVPVTPASLVSTVQGVQPPTLVLEFTPPDTAPNGQSALDVIITNPNTNSALTGIAVTIHLPAGLQVLSNNPHAPCGSSVDVEPDSIRITNGRLSPDDDQCGLQVPVRAGSDDFYTVSSNRITANESGPGDAAVGILRIDTSVSSPPPGADLRIKVSAPGHVLLGHTYPYKVTVTNTGPAAASSVVAMLAVSGRSRIATTHHHFGSVAAGHSVSFTVTEIDPLPGTLTATGTVTSTTPDPDSGNDRTTVKTRVVLF